MIVVVGDNQKSYTSKSEVFSPISHAESAFCTAGIEAEEGRNITILDIPNAYVKTELAINDKPVFVLMMIKGRLDDMLVKIDPLGICVFIWYIW